MKNFYPSPQGSNSRRTSKESFGFLKRKMMKKRLALFLFFLISYSSAWAHAVQVGYVVLSNGFIRVYIEHWHGDQTSGTLVNNGMSITTTYGVSTVTQNVNPTGAFNNTSWNNLPGAGSNIIILSKGPSANKHNDWAYYDFAPAACNVPVNITLNGGLTVVLEEESTNLWPQSISGTFNDTSAPTITVSNTTTTVSCGTSGANVNFAATALDNCTQNPNVTYSKSPGSFFPVGITNVTAFSTDANGNSSQLTFPVTVNILDNVNPILSVPSSFVTANSAGICGSIVTYLAPSATDNCSTTTITQTAGLTSGVIFPNGITTNSFKATDASGNSVTASFTVTVTDNQAPVITCPFNITVNANPAICGAVIKYNQPSATDNCGSGNLPTSLPGYTYKGTLNGHTYFVSNNQVSPEEAHTAAISLGGHLVTIANAAENSFVSAMHTDRMWIGYTDRDVEGIYRWVTNEPVTYTNWNAGEPNNSGGGIGEDWAVINWTGPTWNDWFYNQPAYYVVEFEGGTIPTILMSGLASGSVFPVGTTVVTYRATDTSGNSTNGSFNVIVNDVTAPIVISKPVSVTLAANGTVSITPQVVLESGTDNCLGAITYTLSQSLFGETDAINSPVTIKLTGIDASGNMTSVPVQVTVIDPVPVVITKNIFVSLDASGNAIFTPQQIDNGSSSVVGLSGLSLDKTSFNCTNIGVNTVVLTATSTLGSTSTGTATVTVEDKVVPVVVTQNITIELNGAGSASITEAQINNKSTDNCGIASISLDKTAFDCSNFGANTVTLTVTDVHGNVSSNTATVTVEDKVVPVVVTQNIAIQLNAAGSASITEAQINNGSTDNCGIASISLDKTAFDCSNVGANTVILTVTDIHGNVSSNTATVTVEDKVAPVVLTQNITIQLNAAGSASITEAQINNGSTDNCGIASISMDKTAFDCSNFGANTVILTVMDIHGNVSSNTATVTVEDKVVPVVLTQNIAIQLNASGSASIAATQINNGSTDNCGIASISLDKTAFDCSNVGANTVTLTVTDIHGNVSSNTATVTVEDKVVPVVLTQNIAIQLNASGSASIAATQINNGSTDNCGIASISLDKTAFDCSNVGANTVTLTVTDIHGNVSSNTATVTVEDKVVPVVLTQNLTIQLNASGSASIAATQINNGSTDNCGIATIVLSKIEFLSENLGLNTVTLTVTDIHGNTSSQTATVTVKDDMVPTITSPKTIVVNCGASLLPSNTGMATATDNSTEPAKIFITYADSALPSVCGGNFTRIWTAKDASNNTSSIEQVISIIPAALPTMTAPNSVTISIACGSEPEPSTLSFTNGLSGDCLLSGTSLNSTFALVESTCGGTYIETWTASDACGRTITPVSRTVTVNQNMGAVESFVFFSAEGAVGNTGVSTITGNIGTSIGAITGFGSPSTVSGSTAYANAATTQAKKDLLNFYIHLSNIPVTVTSHPAVFGNGETLSAGVYSIGAAGSLAGTLTLNGENNPNALFIFKYNGAFSVAASSKLILTNGLKASNVLWMAEGAISIGALSVMKGTFLAHTGAVSMGAGGDLEGRMVSTTGAVTFDSGKAYLPTDLSMIPIICVNTSLSNNTLLGSAAKFTLFTGAGAVSNLAISGIIGDVGTNAGSITGFESSATTLVNDIYIANEITVQAKTDLDNAYQQLYLKPGISLMPTLAGLTLTPGVYSISGAGTLTGTLTLDGQGDPNAEFIIKFGGAFSTGAQSKVSLINGARSCNVFWVSEGAISMGASSFMKGTLIAHNGAISMGARGNLEGRMLSTSGAISFNTAVAYTSYLNCVRNSPVSASKKSSTSKLPNTLLKLETTTLIAYPNPFTTNTTVSFTLPYEEANATLVIYDLKGTIIQSLYDGYANANQKYEVQFDRKNMSTGIYIFRLITSKEAKSFKVIVQ